MSSANEQSLVVFNQPNHPPHVRSVFGRLIATLSGVLFFPFGVWGRFPEYVDFEETTPDGQMSPDEEEWYMNRNARKFLEYAKTFTPQVLFRGFTPDSGGGGDKRLNGRHGVVPHGFLNGTIPTTMWNTLHLFVVISGHLEGAENIVSNFSSWSQMWMTALRFSRYPDNKDGRIAVLDTASIEEKVWSSCDLLRADLSQDEYPDEYLIYGPIAGPNYHYVSPFELYSKTRISDLLRSTPFIFGEDPGNSAIELGAVRGAMDVAAFLQPRSGRGETLAVLTARFVSYRAAKITQADRRRFLSYADIDRYLFYVGLQIQCLAMHDQDGEVTLVEDTMYALDRCLRFEVQLLQAVQNAVRVKTYDMRTTMWEFCRLQQMDELWVQDVKKHLQSEDDDWSARGMLSSFLRGARNDRWRRL